MQPSWFSLHPHFGFCWLHPRGVVLACSSHLCISCELLPTASTGVGETSVFCSSYSLNSAIDVREQPQAIGKQIKHVQVSMKFHLQNQVEGRRRPGDHSWMIPGLGEDASDLVLVVLFSKEEFFNGAGYFLLPPWVAHRVWLSLLVMLNLIEVLMLLA